MATLLRKEESSADQHSGDVMVPTAIGPALVMVQATVFLCILIGSLGSVSLFPDMNKLFEGHVFGRGDEGKFVAFGFWRVLLSEQPNRLEDAKVLDIPLGNDTACRELSGQNTLGAFSPSDPFVR